MFGPWKCSARSLMSGHRIQMLRLRGSGAACNVQLLSRSVAAIGSGQPTATVAFHFECESRRADANELPKCPATLIG